MLRRVRPYFLVAAIAIFVAELAFGHPGAVDWVLGLAMGALVALWIALRDSLPGYIENHRTGAAGERDTARELAPLRRRGWIFVHDIPTARANRDHVAVSASGVYLLDSKRYDGEIEVDGDVVRVQRLDDPDGRYEAPLGAGMRARAAELKREVEAATGYRPWVQAVIVFWGHFPAGVVTVDRVTFVHGRLLADWLAGQPERLTAEQTAAIASSIRSG